MSDVNPYGSRRNVNAFCVRYLALLSVQAGCLVGVAESHRLPARCALWATLCVIAGSLKVLVGHVVIHACAHPGSFSGSAAFDHRVRAWLCFANLQDHRDYILLHRFHHRYTQTDRDPNQVRPSDSWLGYVATLFYRQVVFLSRPDYRREFARIFPCAQVNDVGGRYRQFVEQHPTQVIALPLAVLSHVAVAMVAGGAGLAALVLWWLLPMAAGYTLLADFAYRSHRDLPGRPECRPYVGQDTHALKDGLVYGAANLLTCGFYDHVAHHVRPASTVWANREAS